MRHLVSALALVALFSPSARDADGLSGAWSSGTGASSRTYVFKVHGDRFDGIMCGPSDDPSSVFRIEDGRMLDAERVSFSIAYGSHREEIGGTRSGSQLTLRAQREGGSGPPVTAVVKRVIENYPGLTLASSTATVRSSGGAEKVAPFEGKWVAAAGGRDAPTPPAATAGPALDLATIAAPILAINGSFDTLYSKTHRLCGKPARFRT